MNASGSLSLPADSRGALTVGAAPFSSPVTVEGYSSRGPTPRRADDDLGFGTIDLNLVR